MSHALPPRAPRDSTPTQDRAPTRAKLRQLGLAAAKATRTARFWAAPIAITSMLLAALAAVYLGGILKSSSSIRHFPIAVVNEDTGPLGEKIANGLTGALDKTNFDVRALSRDDVRRQMDNARIYGAALIPPKFTSTLQQAAKSATGKEKVTRPIVLILTNPRAGTQASNIAGEALTRAMEAVSRKVGEQLAPSVAEAQQKAGAPIDRATLLTLANPIDVQARAYNPLPDGTGNGLSAFYYSLLLLLAGFAGSIVVNRLVDSMLEQVEISRFGSLLSKWALMLVLALPTSVLYMAMGKTLGMPIDHGWGLWLYGVFAITAVGITSTSLIVALDSIGLLVSLFLFVVLGLPSVGGTVPLESQPSFFGLLAKFEPMQQVFLGARALLYLDGRAGAGLSQALVLTAIWLVIGLLLGAIVTRVRDRRDRRQMQTAPESVSADAAPEMASADDAPEMASADQYR